MLSYNISICDKFHVKIQHYILLINTVFHNTVIAVIDDNTQVLKSSLLLAKPTPTQSHHLKNPSQWAISDTVS